MKVKLKVMGFESRFEVAFFFWSYRYECRYANEAG
jgi:hypothetical protein